MGVLGTVTAIGMVDYFAGDLPTIEQLQTSKLTQTSRILDRNGNLIEALYHQNRTVVPLSKISTKLQRATIDTEDRSFYANSGVDYRRLLIAIVYDLTHHTATLGGSTITEQVVTRSRKFSSCISTRSLMATGHMAWKRPPRRTSRSTPAI